MLAGGMRNGVELRGLGIATHIAIQCKSLYFDFIKSRIYAYLCRCIEKL